MPDTKPSMKEAMTKWLDKKNLATKDWLPVCKMISSDDAVRSLCMKLAEDYEAKKIPEIELMASLSTISGKTLDELEKILGEVVNGQSEKKSQMFDVHQGQVDEQCDILSPQYADLSGYLDTLSGVSFLIEPSPAGQPVRKIDEILEKLKQGVASVQDSAIFRDFLITMSKFWNYSIGNQILIMLQMRGATRVAGFNTWKDLGRYVKAGEHGIAILAPCLPPRNTVLTCLICGKSPFTEDELTKHLQVVHGRVNVRELVKRAKEESGSAGRAMFFKVVYVFDISQTEGKPLVEFIIPSLSGEANNDLLFRVTNLAKAQDIAITSEPRPELGPDTKGFYENKHIWFKHDELAAQQLKTLLHEMAHYYTEDVFNLPKSDAETIAESTAFVVGAHFGFDSGIRTFPYVAYWAREKSTLERNLNTIRSVSTLMINEMEI